MQYRLIAIDVDGTLLDDEGKLRPRVRRAVREAAAAGAEIVLCTGRGPVSTLPLMAELGLSGTIITHNGAVILESESRRILHEEKIPRRLAAPYLNYCRERGIHFAFNTAFELYVEKELSRETLEIYSRYWIRPIVRKEPGPPENTVRLTVYGSREEIDDMEARWSGWSRGLSVHRSDHKVIDLQHPEATKGSALERLARLRGLSRREVLAIGNYYNDISMLRYAGRSVAVANAPAEVRAAAGEVTRSNNEDGVALVLEELLRG